MEPTPISQNLLQFIDDMWIYMVPLIIAYMARGFISNLFSWFLIRFSKMDYYSEGGQVLWDNKWQTVFKITFTHVALFYMVEGESRETDQERYNSIKDLTLRELLALLKMSRDKMIITVIPNSDYRSKAKTFKAKF